MSTYRRSEKIKAIPLPPVRKFFQIFGQYGKSFFPRDFLKLPLSPLANAPQRVLNPSGIIENLQPCLSPGAKTAFTNWMDGIPLDFLCPSFHNLDNYPATGPALPAYTRIPVGHAWYYIFRRNKIRYEPGRVGRVLL